MHNVAWEVFSLQFLVLLIFFAILVVAAEKWLHQNLVVWHFWLIKLVAGFVCAQGLIVLWDVDGGLALVDKYLYSNDNHVVAGALLAVGIVNCGVHNECDPVCPYSYPAEFYSILHLVCFLNMLFLQVQFLSLFPFDKPTLIEGAQCYLLCTWNPELLYWNAGICTVVWICQQGGPNNSNWCNHGSWVSICWLSERGGWIYVYVLGGVSEECLRLYEVNSFDECGESVWSSGHVNVEATT